MEDAITSPTCPELAMTDYWAADTSWGPLYKYHYFAEWCWRSLQCKYMGHVEANAYEIKCRNILYAPNKFDTSFKKS